MSDISEMDQLLGFSILITTGVPPNLMVSSLANQSDQAPIRGERGLLEILANAVDSERKKKRQCRHLHSHHHLNLSLLVLVKNRAERERDNEAKREKERDG